MSEKNKAGTWAIVCIKEGKVIGYWNHSTRIFLKEIEVFTERIEAESEFERAVMYLPKKYDDPNIIPVIVELNIKVTDSDLRQSKQLWDALVEKHWPSSYYNEKREFDRDRAQKSLNQNHPLKDNL